MSINGEDQITVNKLHKLVTDSIAVNDTRWKKIEPVVEAYHNQKIIDRFVGKVWKGCVALLTVLAIIGSIVSVIWAIFIKGH